MQCVVGTARPTCRGHGRCRQGGGGGGRGIIASQSVLSPSVESSDMGVGWGWRVIVGGSPERADSLSAELAGGWSLRGV